MRPRTTPRPDRRTPSYRRTALPAPLLLAQGRGGAVDSPVVLPNVPLRRRRTLPVEGPLCPTSALGSTGLEQTPGKSLFRELVPRLLNACPTERPPSETDCIDSPTEVIP